MLFCQYYYSYYMCKLCKKKKKKVQNETHVFHKEEAYVEKLYIKVGKKIPNTVPLPCTLHLMSIRRLMGGRKVK